MNKNRYNFIKLFSDTEVMHARCKSQLKMMLLLSCSLISKVVACLLKHFLKPIKLSYVFNSFCTILRLVFYDEGPIWSTITTISREFIIQKKSIPLSHQLMTCKAISVQRFCGKLHLWCFFHCRKALVLWFVWN